jgi:hypothetical protein
MQCKHVPKYHVKEQRPDPERAVNVFLEPLPPSFPPLLKEREIPRRRNPAPIPRNVSRTPEAPLSVCGVTTYHIRSRKNHPRFQIKFPTFPNRHITFALPRVRMSQNISKDIPLPFSATLSPLPKSSFPIPRPPSLPAFQLASSWLAY